MELDPVDAYICVIPVIEFVAFIDFVDFLNFVNLVNFVNFVAEVKLFPTLLYCFNLAFKNKFCFTPLQKESIFKSDGLQQHTKQEKHNSETQISTQSVSELVIQVQIHGITRKRS